MLKIMNQKKIWIILSISLLLSALCFVQIMRENHHYYYEGSTVFEEGIVSSNTVVYEQISLPPGVYDIELEYQTDSDSQHSCSVSDETVFFGGLLANAVNLYSGLDKTSYRIWIFESTDALCVSVSYNGKGFLETGNLSIHETNLLWTMFLAVILFVTMVFVGIVLLVAYDRRYGISKEQKNVLFGLIVISIIASLPFLQGYSVSGNDLTYHMLRIEGVKDGLLSGQFPVRLEPEWLHGHGYANAVMYCNALLLFPAILRLLGFTVTTSYNIFAIALNIATVWISYYCFMKIFKDRYIGLICSALYTLSLIRIFKLVKMSATGEGSAFTFLPLILYGFVRVFTENPKDKSYKTAWLPIAFGYAGLMQTHVLTCEITALLTVMVCVVFLKKILCLETFLELAKGALGALLMSLWYLVPFLDYYMNENLHIRNVSARTIQVWGLYPAQLAFHYWKLGSNALTEENPHAMGVGLVLVIGLLVFAILWFGGKWRKNKHTVISLGKVSAIFAGMLMLMSLYIFPWDKIQEINELTASLVSGLQFPNRFLGWGTVFLVTVFGCCLWYFRKKADKWYYYSGIICALVGITTSSMYFQEYVSRDLNHYEIYSAEAMGFGYISGGEYLAEGTDADLLIYKQPAASEGIEITYYEKEYLNVKLSCSNTAGEEGYIELPILHYTGYHAYDQDMKEELTVMKGDNNVIRVMIPEGYLGNIEVKFVSPIYWRVSEIISYISIAAILIISLRVWQKTRRRGAVHEYA